MTQPASPASEELAPTRRVQAVVALRLLEVMRDRDLPQEFLEEEDPTRTIPRRFGLSDVVERQIRQLRDDVKRRVLLTDQDVQALFRFVLRRPDGPEVFHRVGRLLADADRPSAWVRVLPRGLRYRLARSRTRRRLRQLFGRPVGGLVRPPFCIEGRSLLFIEADPGGDVCHLLSGLAEGVLEHVLGGVAEVRHTRCQSRGDDVCRWEGSVEDRATRIERDDATGLSEDESVDEGAVDAEDAEVLDDGSTG